MYLPQIVGIFCYRGRQFMAKKCSVPCRYTAAKGFSHKVLKIQFHSSSSFCKLISTISPSCCPKPPRFITQGISLANEVEDYARASRQKERGGQHACCPSTRQIFRRSSRDPTTGWGALIFHLLFCRPDADKPPLAKRYSAFVQNFLLHREKYTVLG